jgi:hypothetical protein
MKIFIIDDFTPERQISCSNQQANRRINQLTIGD